MVYLVSERVKYVESLADLRLQLPDFLREPNFWAEISAKRVF